MVSREQTKHMQQRLAGNSEIMSRTMGTPLHESWSLCWPARLTKEERTESEEQQKLDQNGTRKAQIISKDTEEQDRGLAPLQIFTIPCRLRNHALYQ